MYSIGKILLFFSISILPLFTVNANSKFTIANNSQDSVQAVLRQLAKTHPEKVSFIVETYRWHLNNPRPEAVSDDVRIRLQDAFYYDIQQLCKFYGQKYLMNWEAIASKAARETFWGTSYLCNRAFNYFGIRRINKPWTCESFGFCQGVTLKDPTPSEFVVFSDFESSLWMFIHTAYSAHFLDRLPDYGLRVGGAIIFERQHGVHYWENNREGYYFADQLYDEHYTLEEIIYTWSGHEVNNLCVECSWESDMNWVGKLRMAQGRARR